MWQVCGVTCTHISGWAVEGLRPCGESQSVIRGWMPLHLYANLNSNEPHLEILMRLFSLLSTTIHEKESAFSRILLSPSSSSSQLVS